MSGKRQKTEDPLALVPNGRGETLAVGSPRAEPLMAKPASESPALGSNAFRAQLRIPTGVSAHRALSQAQPYVAEGYNIVVDLDLEKFFDRVNHDGLMARVAARISD